MQGVGRASAEIFAREGYNVVIAARNPEKILEAKAQLARYCAPGRACLGISTDITQGDAVDGLVAAVTQQCESVDILINCAGRISLPSLPMSAAAWLHVCRLHPFRRMGCQSERVVEFDATFARLHNLSWKGVQTALGTGLLR